MAGGISLGIETILVSKILKGDKDSFSSLVGIYQNQLYNFIYKLTYSKEDSEEILQDVFIKVYNNLYRYDSRYSFSTWIYRIAINTFKTSYRVKKRNSGCDYMDELSNDALIDFCSPDMLLESKESYLDIVRIINVLKEEQKIVFILRYVKNFSYKEIGEMIGLSPEAARMKAHRARNNLWDRLKESNKRRASL